MNKKVAMVFLMVCAIISFSFSQVLQRPIKQMSIKSSITVQNPRTGTVWTIGKRVSIAWETTGLKMEYVQIMLFPVNRAGLNAPPAENVRTKRIVISAKTRNRGSFSWIVPRIMKPGNYRLIVANLDNTVQGKSPLFKIRDFPKLILPDLVITGEYLGWTNPPEDPEDTGYVRIRVTNTNHPNPKFYCCGSQYCFTIKVQSGSDPSEFYTVSCVDLATLNSQGWAEKTISIWDPGWFPLKLTVDCTGLIIESDESNNTYTVPTPAQL